MDNKDIHFHIEYENLDGYLRGLRHEEGSKPYWLMPYGDFGFEEDEEDYALTDEFWEMDTPYYTTIDEVLNKKNKTIRYNVKKSKKTTLWSHVITFQKNGKYGPNNVHQIALIDGRGTYPLKSTKNMAEYVARLKDGKIRQPNFNTVRNNILLFEEDNKNPEV